MHFNKHFNLVGKHASLSPSSFHWIHYDVDKLEEKMLNSMAAQRGTELHDLAHQLIRLGVKLPNTSATLNQYVNDVIGYKMHPEVLLYYSDNCFGTADALDFKRNTLRIFDLKTGVIPAHIEQLEVYAALFCLEYDMKPTDIKIDLRIYQSDECIKFDADMSHILYIMDKIVYFDKKIIQIRTEALA
jgi:hypothetical protein